MEGKKTNPIQSPGIPEAIHPEIGNGVAWEQHPHSMLLRIPDATKPLDEYLNTGIVDASSSESLQDPVDASIQNDLALEKASPEEANPQPVAPEPETEDSATETEIVKKPAGNLKQKKKTTSKKQAKEPKLKGQESAPPISHEEKSPKAGKLVRKAAKSVKRQEAKKKQVKKEEIYSPDLSLSPYTQWLKSLSGSDYVHPYEDDFAIHQGTGRDKEGISETFAELLASQGYKEQAMEMYLRLMEKYPEKSSFFAAKIEALQQ